MFAKAQSRNIVGITSIAGIVGVGTQDQDQVGEFGKMIYQGKSENLNQLHQENLGLSRLFYSGPKSDQRLASSSSICVAFDGVLFNYDQLVKSVDFAHPPNASRPAQLLICLYRKEGIGFLRRLVGEFSIALWDEELKNLFLAVDFLASRPLFYRYLSRDSFAFASTISQLRRADDIPNKTHLFERIGTSFSGPVPTRSTPVSGVSRVSPGMYITLSVDSEQFNVKRNRYWHLRNIASIKYRKQSEYADHLRSLVFESLDRNLCAFGGPTSRVGVSFSGGVDSSAVLCALRTTSNSLSEELFALTVTFSERTGDEPFQTDVFQSTGIDKKVISVDRMQFLDYDKWSELYHLDEPLHSLMCSSLLLEMLAQTASEFDASLLLTGLGGDGLFNGNPYWIADSIRQGKFIRAIRGIQDWSKTENQSLANSIQEFFGRAWSPHGSDFIRMIKSPIFNEDQVALQWGDIAEEFSELNQPGPLSRGITYYHVLLDVCSYARNRYFFERYGIRESNPFFYQPLIEYMLGIPAEMNYHISSTGDIVRKKLLRESMTGIVPVSILRRRTKGLAGNVGVSQMIDARYRLEQLFLRGNSRLVDLGIVCPVAIRNYVDTWHMNLEVFRWCFPVIATELWLRQNF